MKVEVSPRKVRVILSKRNLLSLLDKLSWEQSARTIVREQEDGTLLVVTAETDEEHYTDRSPGIMHPRTEAALRQGDNH